MVKNWFPQGPLGVGFTCRGPWRALWAFLKRTLVMWKVSTRVKVDEVSILLVHPTARGFGHIIYI